MNNKLLPVDYAERRKCLLSQVADNAVIFVPAAKEQLRNRDVGYPFRQNSDFRWLTGFPEPDALAVLDNRPGQPSYRLFCRPKDLEQEIWHGRRCGPNGAVEQFAADEAFDLDQLDDVLQKSLAGVDTIYYPLGQQHDFDQQVMGWVNALKLKARQGIKAPTQLRSLDGILDELRLRKSEAELSRMRCAAEISSLAHRRAMQVCQPGTNEYELEAELEYIFSKHGAGWAYSSIVGGGANSCILHYTENNEPLNDGELVLIDAGAEVEGYAADITRTFPVNGHFTGEQRAIYELVLASQTAAIQQVRIGESYNAYHAAAVGVLTQGLVDLGLLTGEVDSLIEDEAFKPYYMHKTGHWLGMDVHDVGDYRVADEQGALDWRPLETNMTLTVEPGLYISAGSDCDERWWNTGVRIEDDVCVTDSGPEVMTSDAPKEITDIEALMAGN